MHNTMPSLPPFLDDEFPMEEPLGGVGWGGGEDSHPETHTTVHTDLPLTRRSGYAHVNSCIHGFVPT